MAAQREAYMLQRDAKESKRLDNQHSYLLELMDGEFIHPSIPQSQIRAVADIGTGTGIWLRDLQKEMSKSQGNQKRIEYVGFDISSAQFPQESWPGVELVVHDVVQAFPEAYRGKFDLVHVRLLTFAFKAEDLTRAIESVCDIIRKWFP